VPRTQESLAAWDPTARGERADPYPTYARARREAPVFYNEFLRAWVVTRYDDVLAVLRDVRTFTSRYVLDSGGVPPELADRLPHGYPWSCPGIGNQDPPAHTPVRRLANEGFKPQALAAREPEIQAIADELIDRFPAGRVEFVSAFANPLPVHVLCRLLEIPDERVPDIFRWSDEMLPLVSNPGLSREERLARSEGMAEFSDFLGELVDERRAAPGTDVLSRLIHGAGADGAPLLDRASLVAVCAQLITAGIDTVARLLGLMLLRLLEQPGRLAAVRAQPALAAAAVEETLRHSTSNLGLPRRTTRAVTLGGAEIPAGADLVLMFASANRDDARFADPDSFDPGRDDVDRHLAFGKYTHFCLGAPLARLEARIALERLVARLPNLRRANDDALEYQPLALHMALERLDLAWDS
jgi:cytochrome P450